MNQSATLSRHTISLYVNNKPGVLNRIALVFSRRGWNIESLAVSSAHDERFSRCTITAFGDPDMLTRIIGQLGKLVDVVHAAEHTFDESFEAELALIKVRAVADDHMRVVEIAAPWSARVVDRSAGTMVLQVAGDPLDVEQLHRMLSDTFEVIEIVRSGPLRMVRGEEET